MRPARAFDSEQWLSQQITVIRGLFERAASELEGRGIRLLAGSVPPDYQGSELGKSITIRPVRFSGSNGEQPLSLTLLATRSGLPRYVVALQMSGAVTRDALQRLAVEYTDIFDKLYLRSGLWFGEGAESKLLNDLSQITRSSASEVSITGVFLHSDLERTVQEGIMIIGLLYRTIFDEVSGACKMRRLYAQLSGSSDYRTVIFQRIIRP